GQPDVTHRAGAQPAGLGGGGVRIRRQPGGVPGPDSGARRARRGVRIAHRLRHVPGLRGSGAPIMGGTTVSGRLTGRAFVLPGFLLVLVALGGRYTLDRAGLRDLTWVDLRLVGVAVGITVLAIDLARRPRPHLDHRSLDHRPEGWLVVATLFFMYQI